jgi:adenylate cyclase
VTTPLEAGPLPALYDVLDFLSRLREGDEDRVWSRVIDKLCVALGADAATYYTFLPKLRQLIARYSLGASAKQLSGAPIELGAGLCGWVAKHREAALVADPYGDPRFLKAMDEKTGFKTRNLLAVPLDDRLELAGVVELLNKRSGPFTPDDLRFVEAACRATALTLRNFRLEATVDKVTSSNASILENLGGGFLAIDMRGRLILCNPSARRILGISPELPLNLPVEQALGTIPEIAEILAKTASTRQTVKRQELRWTRDGQERVLGYSTIMIQDPQGNVSGAGITFQDITNVKH